GNRIFSEENGLRHGENAFFSFQTDFFHFKWTQPTAVCVFFISNGLICQGLMVGSRWLMVKNPRSTVDGQRSIVDGQWSMVISPRSSGLRSPVSRLRSCYLWGQRLKYGYSREPCSGTKLL